MITLSEALYLFIFMMIDVKYHNILVYFGTKNRIGFILSLAEWQVKTSMKFEVPLSLKCSFNLSEDKPLYVHTYTVL